MSGVPLSTPLGVHEKSRLGHVDALRGIAATYVFLFHLTEVPSPSPNLPSWATQLLAGGWSGVTLFFVLSAWTLAMTRDARDHEDRPDLRFLVRRFFRIAPLFYCWLIFMVIRNYGFTGFFDLKERVISNLTFTFNFYPPWQQGIVWASWTLGVEMVFYALFPLVWRLTRSVRSAAGFLGVSLVVSWVIQFTVYRVMDEASANIYIALSLATSLPAFGFGILAYRIQAAVTRSDRLKSWKIPLLIAGGLTWSILLTQIPTWGVRAFFQPFAYSCILLGIHAAPPRWLSSSAMCNLGKISYSLYLNHPYLVYSLAPLYFLYNGWFHPESGISFGLSVLTAGTLLITISYMSWRWIEEPGNRLGRKVLAHIPKRSNS